MKIVTKLVAASILALSVAAPAFAAEESTFLERNTYVNAPLGNARTDAMAYATTHAPAAKKNVVIRDFGIGSQS